MPSAENGQRRAAGAGGDQLCGGVEGCTGGRGGGNGIGGKDPLCSAVGIGAGNGVENQIERQNPFTMEQFAASVNKFLTFNDYKILPDKGRISSAQAKAKAESEYDIFNRTQRIDSDFDKEVNNMLGK